MEQIILNRSYLLTKVTFWGDFSYAHAIFLRAVYLFHHSNCSHTSLEVVYLFLSQKAWQAFILWSVVYLFWQENLQSSIVWVILSAEICLFPKEVGSSYAFFQSYYNYFYRIFAAIHFFNGTVHFYDVKICSHLIFPIHFLSVYIRTPVTVKQTRYHSSYTFRAASIMLEWEQPLEAASFSQKDFFQNT